MKQQNSFLWRILCISLFTLFLLPSCEDEQEIQMFINMESTAVTLDSGNNSAAIITGKCSGPWEAIKENDWFEISETSGSNDINITVTTNSANPITEARISKITITVGDGSKKIPVTITQAGSVAVLETDKHEIIANQMGAIGNTANDSILNITSNMKWEVEIEQGIDWFTVNNSAGEGNGSIRFTFKENKSINSYSTIVKVIATEANGSKIEKEIAVTQTAYDAPTLTLTPATITATEDEETYYVAVTSNTTWSSEKSTDTDTWYTLTDEEENNRIKVDIKTNIGVERKATFKVIASTFETKKTEYVEINQNGAPTSIEVSNTTLIISADGKTQEPAELTVTSNADWSATSSASWLTLLPTSGVPSTEAIPLLITAEENLFVDGRSATITVQADENTKKTITVTQIGAAINFNLTKIDADFTDVDGGGDTKTFSVTSNAPWSATVSGADWVTITPASGSASETATVVTVTIKTNTDLANGRDGALITVTPIGFESSAQTISVSQSKGDLSPEAKKLMEILSALNNNSTVTPTNWGTPDLTLWQGITLVNGSVSGIELPSKGFDGVISEKIADLSSLTKLDLSGNNLTGNIPQKVAIMTTLTTLKVSGNKLTGRAPDDIANNPNYFSWNAMTNIFFQQGDTPTTLPKNLKFKLSDIGAMRVFYWSTNGPSWRWGGAATVAENNPTVPEWLYENVTLSGGPAKCEWVAIQYINSAQTIRDLGSNNVAGDGNSHIQDASGVIPDEIGMTNIIQLRLNGNKFTKIPAPFAKNLAYFNLSNCELDMDIEEFFTNYVQTGVRELFLPNVGLKGTNGLPAIIKTFTGSTININLSNNPQLSGTISQDIIDFLKTKGMDDAKLAAMIAGTGLQLP